MDAPAGPSPEHKLAENVRDACLKAARAGYEDAALRGLCREGAWEAAMSAVEKVDLATVVEDSA